MADRIDIGFGPRLGPERPEPTSFEYVGATALSPEQYQSRFVNYANQYIGSPSLEEQTGVAVEAAPEVGQTTTTTRPDDDDGPSVPIFMQEDTTFGLDAFAEDYTGNYNTYSDYLQSIGKTDRINVVDNLYSPP